MQQLSLRNKTSSHRTTKQSLSIGQTSSKSNKQLQKSAQSKSHRSLTVYSVHEEERPRDIKKILSVTLASESQDSHKEKFVQTYDKSEVKQEFQQIENKRRSNSRKNSEQLESFRQINQIKPESNRLNQLSPEAREAFQQLRQQTLADHELENQPAAEQEGHYRIRKMRDSRGNNKIESNNHLIGNQNHQRDASPL